MFKNNNIQDAIILDNSGLVEQNKVLSQTMQLLSYTLIFGGLMSWLSTALSIGFTVSLVTSIVALAVIWFVLPKTENSSAGVPTAFAIAGLLGFSIGPILEHTLAMANGSSVVFNALATTGVAFFGISYYAQKSGKDFSFLNGFLFFAILAVIALSLINIFFIESSLLSLGISFAVVLLMGAFLLSEISSIVNGGETNYVRATVGIYLALHNMFVSLLHIFGAFNDD